MAQTAFEESVDLLIAGGGVVGAALAVAVKQALGASFNVELWDPAWGRRSPRQRVSAIAAAPKRMLETLGVWPSLGANAQPILRMDITDSQLEDAVRPTLLSFAGEPAPGEPFAHMVFNGDLEAALASRAAAVGALVKSELARLVELGARGAIVEDSSGRRVRAAVVAAADGARSPLRESAGIETLGWSYRAQAIVCTVEHERDHRGCARQHFLPEGPFARLPLPGRASSIVWTLPGRRAETLISLAPDAFRQELEIRFGRDLGPFAPVDAPLKFEVGFRQARRLVAGRLALLGDAARSIHQLAGQGLNIGLRDAAALAEAIVETARLGLEPDERTLRRYQTARRFDSLAMSAATDLLNRTFQAKGGPLRLARDWGLGLVDHSGALKRLLIQEASGFAGSPPRLLVGDAL